MKSEKILEAIKTSITHLETSLKALGKDEKEAMNFSWRAASELEYTLFLFSIMCTDEIIRVSWKLDSSSKTFDIRSSIITTLDLLKKAKLSFETESLDEAYKETWMARGHLFRIHDLFEKRRGRK